jgi:serine protein kinase
MSKEIEARDELTRLGERIRLAFIENRRVMSFAEYLDLLAARPGEQLRSAPQYIRDCFDYYGTEIVSYPWGPARRFKLFDCPWADGRDRLIGQEDVQNRIYRALSNFVSEGVSNKLLLLHGPNGSAKSTLVRCIGRAMQHYSTTDAGAVYRINWIFPAQKMSKSGIGFSGADYTDPSRQDTFAYLSEDLMDAKLRDELRDHPVFLIPAREREQLLRRLLPGSFSGDPDFVLSDYIRFGRLSHKNRLIYESLLASYQGDYLKVMRHVQVERFFVRHRYREGYVTVEPQLSVDAGERQVTADRSLTALPAALQSVTLYDYGGELVGGNRGMIEYSDLLKRPLEAYKYLITTVERASVSLSNAILFLDLFFIGTSNEIHLAAFKEVAEFQSFKGRLELVRVPYLLDFTKEQMIYRQKLREAASSRHVAPHCDYVAALWAVLTRMRKPMPDKYPSKVADLIARLTPLEKAELYGLGQAPERLAAAEARELLAHIDELWRESESYPNYEGRSGASPRELQVAIFNAASSERYEYVSPLAILEELEDLTKQTSVYPFLKQEALPGGFHDHKRFVEVVRARLVDAIDDEVRSALGLVDPTEYERLFDRYISHVMHWTRGEKVFNPTTGREQDADEQMMREVEETLEVADDSEDFRRDLIAKIGAWSLDHTGERPDYKQIFADHFKRMRESYYAEQRATVQSGVKSLMSLLTGDAKVLSDEQRAEARRTLATLTEEFGYNEASARDAVSLLARARYS